MTLHVEIQLVSTIIPEVIIIQYLSLILNVILRGIQLILIVAWLSCHYVVFWSH